VTIRTARSFDPQPDAVLIIVDPQFSHFLHKTARRTLMPEHLPTAAEVMRLARADGFLQGFSVHVADHEQLASGVVGGDGGHESAGVKLGSKVASFLNLFNSQTPGEWVGGGHGLVDLGFFAGIWRQMSSGATGLILAVKDFDDGIIKGIQKVGLMRWVLAIKTE